MELDPPPPKESPGQKMPNVTSTLSNDWTFDHIEIRPQWLPRLEIKRMQLDIFLVEQTSCDQT